MTRRVIPHSGFCEICDQEIEPGGEVYADDDTAAVHVDCLERDVRAADEREARLQAALDATAYLNGGRLV